MRLRLAPPLLSILIGLVRLSGPQPMLEAQAAASSLPAASTAPLPSEILKPSLDQVRQTVNNLRLDKWKGGSRDEAEANLKSILSDLDGTLPGLLATADATPDQPSKLLPAFRNVEALYDVLLRVTQTAVISAPRPQSDALTQAMASLEAARRGFGDRLQQAVEAQEQQLGTAQAALRSPPAAIAAPAPEVLHITAPTPVTKPRKPKAKVTPKPGTTTTPVAKPAAPAQN